MKPPDKVPNAVLDSIANKYVYFRRQGVCWLHDTYGGEKFMDRENKDYYTEDYNHAPCICSCAVDMKRFEDILKNLEWGMDHYYFTFAGMYVGVELDGHMHT